MFATKSRRFTTRTGVLSSLLAATTVAACAGVDTGSGKEPGSDGLITLRSTVTPGLGSLPFRVALERGFFEANGLKLDVTEGFDLENYVAALDRQFDTVMVVPTTTIQAAANGLRLKAFAGMEAVDDSVLTSPMVTKDPAINSIQDVAEQGKSLGVLRVTGVIKAHLAYSLKGTGADVNDIKLVSVPLTDQIDQLRAGRVDAVISASGFYEPLLKEGFRVVYRHPQHSLTKAGGQLPTIFPHFISSAEFAQNNLSTLKAFRASLLEATKWIDQNKESALKMFAEWIGRDPASMKGTALPTWKVNVEAADFEAWQEIMEFGGLLKHHSDPVSLIQDGM